MTAILSANAGDSAKIAFYINDCRQYGISVLPPKIESSLWDFSVDGDKTIRFGMGAVKNVGQGAAEAIIQEREKNGPFKSLDDFVSRIDLRQVGRRALESLIKVGAMDSFGERGALLAALDDMIATSASKYKGQDSGQMGLFDMFEIPLQKIVLPETTPIESREKLNWEKDLLGLYVSDHPLNAHRSALKRHHCVNHNQLEDIEQNKYITMGGLVQSARHMLTKKDNRAMCAIKLEDINGDITDVVFFPKVWDEVRDIIQVDAPIIVEGRLDKTRGAPQISASKASSLLVNGIAESDAYYADTYSDVDQVEELTPEAQAAAGNHVDAVPAPYMPPPDDGWFDELPPIDDIPMMTDPYEDIPPVSPDEMPDACGALSGPEQLDDQAEVVERKEVSADKPAVANTPKIEGNIAHVEPQVKSPAQPSDSKSVTQSDEISGQDDDDPPFDIDEPAANQKPQNVVKPITEANIEPVTGFFTDPEDDASESSPDISSDMEAKPVDNIAPVLDRVASLSDSAEITGGADDSESVENLDEELFSFDDKPQPRLLTVVVRIEPNAQPGSSGRRIRRLHGLVSSYPGRDHVAFMIFEAGQVYLVDFPNVHTNICNELLSKLREQVGENNIQIEEKAPAR